MSQPADRQLVICAPLRLEEMLIRRGAPRLPVQRIGVGRWRASSAAARLAVHPADAIAVMGLGGGLCASDRPGEVVFASELITLTSDGTPSNRLACTSAPGLLEVLRGHGIAARSATIACSPRIVLGRARQRLQAHGAEVVDMESSWLAPAARGRPFVVIRVIADAPNHDLSRPLRALGGWRVACAVLRQTAAVLQTVADGQPLVSLLEEQR